MQADAPYFESLYAAHADPWQVGSRWYEQRKRALLLAALPEPRYRFAFEPGCGTGDLTAELALRCDRVLASDFSTHAVALARAKTAAHSHVQVLQQALPEEWPQGRAAVFDLIIVSEWGYYLRADALRRVAQLCSASLAPRGTLIACHWRPDFDDRVLPTTAVHQAFAALPGMATLLHHDESDFALAAWSRDPRSVSQRRASE
jgi:SAM-dependent methyltransferase